MQGARERRQTPVRAYATHQVRRQLGRRRRGPPRCLSVGPALMSASGPGGERQSDRECPSGDKPEAWSEPYETPEIVPEQEPARDREGFCFGRIGSTDRASTMTSRLPVAAPSSRLAGSNRQSSACTPLKTGTASVGRPGARLVRTIGTAELRSRRSCSGFEQEPSRPRAPCPESFSDEKCRDQFAIS
jgi:hypothetical protein